MINRTRRLAARSVSDALAQLFADLAQEQLFVIYRLLLRNDGRSDKLPIDPVTQQPIDAQNPSARMLPAEALMWWEQGAGDGVGIVITEESGLWFLDIDHCMESNGWASHAIEFLSRFPGSYIEVSSSGHGLHVLGRYAGQRPKHSTRNKQYRLELYTGKRFCALTGSSAAGSILTDHTTSLHALARDYFPPVHGAKDYGGELSTQPVPDWNGPEDDDELLRRAMRMRNARAVFGAKAAFADLFNANEAVLAGAFPPQSPGQPWDASAADLSLANHLAFLTGNHGERMERLMRRSVLAREKWERPGYLVGTINRACGSTRQWYRDPQVAPVQLASWPAVVKTISSNAPAPAPHVLTLNRKCQYEATIENLVYVLGTQQQATLGYDEFRGRIMIAPRGAEDWRPLSDTDMIQLRETLAREQRFAPISKELMRDALQLVAERRSFDSAITWLNGMTWDGVPRVARYLTTYCEATDDDYSRAVSLYIWTGLAARVLSPGCQLDMVVALQSPQGKQKSTGLQAMVPSEEYFTDGLSLHEDDDDFKRLIRGKLVVEIAELAGLSRGDINIVKRTITRRTEEWIEKWQTLPTRYDRRCMLFATTNDERFLPTDETGNRRWLPVEIGRLNRERIAADRAQLWAEGAVVYAKNGVAWDEAERLARGRHQRYEQTDVWEADIERWLDTPTPTTPGQPIQPPPCTRPIALSEVLQGALRLNAAAMDAKAEKRAGRVMRQLGYENRNTKIEGRVVKRWVRVVSSGSG